MNPIVSRTACTFIVVFAALSCNRADPEKVAELEHVCLGDTAEGLVRKEACTDACDLGSVKGCTKKGNDLGALGRVGGFAPCADCIREGRKSVIKGCRMRNETASCPSLKDYDTLYQVKTTSTEEARRLERERKMDAFLRHLGERH
jgi:hypothetical protein